MAVSAIKLTEIQQNCVTHKPEGDLLIQGIPGSGKSTILLARADYLKEKNPNDSVLFITFSKALTNYSRQLSAKLYSNNLEVKNFHQWGIELLKQTNYPHTRLVVGDYRIEAINFAKNIVNAHSKNVHFPNLTDNKRKTSTLLSFLCDEIEWIKGLGINTREEYLSIKRAGRGNDVKVLKTHRQTIYDVLEKYNELLKKHKKYQGIDGDDLANILIENADQIPDQIKPDHILIDEAQDLNTMQIKAIRKIAKKSLTIGADKGQQIYRRTFTWKQAGVDITGNRSKFLEQTFRSTRQIIRLANQFQEQDKLYIKDVDYQKAQEPDIEGKIPQLCFCQDIQMEDQHILEYVQRIRGSYPKDTIGIIAVSHMRLDSIKMKLNLKGIPVFKIKDNETDFISPGVKLITYHSSKGLEFDHVIVTDLQKGKLPYSKPAPGEDENEFLSRERKKLYVAMTRAKKTLMLIATKEYSPFIDDLNKDLYEIISK